MDSTVSLWEGSAAASVSGGGGGSRYITVGLLLVGIPWYRGSMVGTNLLLVIQYIADNVLNSSSNILSSILISYVFSDALA